MRTWDGRVELQRPIPAEEAFMSAKAVLEDDSVNGFAMVVRSDGMIQQGYARHMSLGERGRLIGEMAWLFMWDASREGVDPYDAWCLLAKYAGDGPSPGLHSELLTDGELDRAKELASSRDIRR